MFPWRHPVLPPSLRNRRPTSPSSANSKSPTLLFLVKMGVGGFLFSSCFPQFLLIWRQETFFFLGAQLDRRFFRQRKVFSPFFPPFHAVLPSLPQGRPTFPGFAHPSPWDARRAGFFSDEVLTSNSWHPGSCIPLPFLAEGIGKIGRLSPSRPFLPVNRPRFPSVVIHPCLFFTLISLFPFFSSFPGGALHPVSFFSSSAFLLGPFFGFRDQEFAASFFSQCQAAFGNQVMVLDPFPPLHTLFSLVSRTSAPFAPPGCLVQYPFFAAWPSLRNPRLFLTFERLPARISLSRGTFP